MSYTIADWLYDAALVSVRIPTPDGHRDIWVPLAVIQGSGGYPPAWRFVEFRTHRGMEARDFCYHMGADGEPIGFPPDMDE